MEKQKSNWVLSIPINIETTGSTGNIIVSAEENETMRKQKSKESKENKSEVGGAVPNYMRRCPLCDGDCRKEKNTDGNYMIVCQVCGYPRNLT